MERDLLDRFDDLDELGAEYRTWFSEHKRELRPMDRYKYIDSDGIYIGSQSVHNPGKEGYRYDVIHPITGRPCKQPLMGYRFPETTMCELLDADKILFGDDESKIIELKVYARDYTDKLPSVLTLDGRLGAYDLRDLFPEVSKAFTNPKPVRLLKSIFSFVLHDDDIVLDFFAGSGSTAHAVMNMNVSGEHNLRFFLVQLDESLDETATNSQAAAVLSKLGKPLNIAEITKERLRRAARKVTAGATSGPPELFGFRVFKLDSSNIRAWDPDPADLEEALRLSVEHVVEGRTEQDLLYEVLLKRGLDLCVPIETREIGGKNVHSIGGGVLMVCLAEELTGSDVEAVAKAIVTWRRELETSSDMAIVFRDSAFVDDVAKTNMAEILKQNDLTNVRSV
ncbi:MAG: DNA methyltransferase [Candidatus Nanopelagicales bacterium]|nr:DNA methyltransferase [Candidatus Nanopelagicales bacterium]